MFKINTIGTILVKEVPPEQEEIAKFINTIVRQTPFRIPSYNIDEKRVFEQYFKEKNGISPLTVNIKINEKDATDEEINNFLTKHTKLLTENSIPPQGTNLLYHIASTECASLYFHKIVSPDDMSFMKLNTDWSVAIILSGSYKEAKTGDVRIFNGTPTLTNNNNNPIWVLYMHSKLSSYIDNTENTYAE